MKSVFGFRLAVIGKEIFLCILSASLLILSFPKFNLEFFAWFGFVPLFFVIEGKSKAKAFLFSYFTGIIFWLGIVYWLVHVTLVGMILLLLYLSLYFGIFAYLISFFSIRYTLYAIPSIWVILEYLRSHLFSGFPWALLGYSQYLNLPMIQIADITGAWGVSFLVMMANVVIYTVLRRAYRVLRQKEIISICSYFLPIFLILVSLIYGFYHLRNTQYSIRNTLKVSVIQGNIPQQLKWDIGSRDFIIDKYLTLTKQALRDKPDLIIWPEAALPVVLEEEPQYYERIVNFIKDSRVPVLLGAVTTEENNYYNSALLISGEGRLLKKYNKLHLVPFGEYIPLRKIFRFLETVVPIGDFAPGKSYTLFSQYTIHNTQYTMPFSVLICFEDLFPDLSREFVKKGAQFLVNITNDAWFKKTSAAYQHLQASVFRTVENRVSLLRSANTGVSGFIAPSGKIISLVQDRGENIFIDGYKTQEIIVPERYLSFYTRYGDVFVAFCFLVVLALIILPFKKKR